MQFNRETLQPYKSQAYIKFGETIYMDRFLDGADLAKKARSKVIQADLMSSRERINLLTHGKVCRFTLAMPKDTQWCSVLACPFRRCSQKYAWLPIHTGRNTTGRRLNSPTEQGARLCKSRSRRTARQGCQAQRGA